MKNSSPKDSSPLSESTRLPPSTPKDFTPATVTSLDAKLRIGLRDLLLQEIASRITDGSLPTLVPLSSTYQLTPLGDGPLLSETPASPPSASTAASQETFDPWRSPTFAPDGSRYLRVASSSPRASTSQRSRWASRSGRLNPSRSGFSSRVEYLGRFQGKTVAVLFDHAGNCLRHGLPTETRSWSLSGVDPLLKRAQPRASLRTCPTCFAVSPQGAVVCRECGRDFPVEPRKVSEQAGELEEVTAETLAKARRKSEQGQAGTYEQLMALARTRRYRNPHVWATAVLKGRAKKRRLA
jgi:hypothetical protein